ncbi:hypothetical protein [Chitinophaga sp.]|uniref:hypothetical protein n=1 Tax=Chitinophaga sp. TaxID=1869181 RepID=UPI002F943697
MNNSQPGINGIPEEEMTIISEEQLNIISRSDSALNTPDNLRDRLANQELQHQFREGVRGEDYRIHIHRFVCIGMYAIGAIIILMILIRAFHFLSPERWHWLTDKENQDIERIIFGTVFISVVGKYFKKYNIIDEPSSQRN